MQTLDMTVTRCTFEKTLRYFDGGSFWCGAGIDIEPNLGETVSNVTFSRCTFSSNAGQGISSGPAYANTPTAVYGRARILRFARPVRLASARGVWCVVASAVTNILGCVERGRGPCNEWGVRVKLFVRIVLFTINPAADSNTVTGNTVNGTLANAAKGVIQDASNVTITGGTIIGDLATHTTLDPNNQAKPVWA